MRDVLLLFVVVAVAIAGVAAQLPRCGNGQGATIDCFVGESVWGTLSAATDCPDGLVLYRATSSGLQVNARGDYLYSAPMVETIERFNVTVGCSPSDAKCVLEVVARVALRIAQPSPTPSPSPDRECAQLFFPVAFGASLSDSLATQPSQAPCTGTRNFTASRLPARGTLVLTPSGDFRYDAPTSLPAAASQYDDFGYGYYCSGALVCRGSAFLTFTATTLPPPTPPPVATGSPAPTSGGSEAPPSGPFVTPRANMQCRGTCNRQAAWKATQSQPELWDLAGARADGKPVGSVETSWLNGKLVVKAYSQIGNMGVRFPAFEPVTVLSGEAFTGDEQLARIAATSVPFDLSCLSQQSAAGLAANVWEWDSIANLSGHAGRHYKSGSDWYQKFNGLHVECDTFLTDACRYSPLLTPAAQQDANLGGTWRVVIDGCDVTWIGEFTFAALRNMRRGDGTPAFDMAQGRYLRTAILTEAVKPASEVRPAAGILTSIEPHSTVLDLVPWVTASVDDTNHLLFSVDAVYFQYTDNATGDAAFGLNLLFYPHVEDSSTTSYSPDRHVTGFRWVSQQWAHPDNTQCPTCTGTDLACALDAASITGDASFMMPEFMSGNCHAPRVVLSRGPSFPAGSCPASRMHNFDQPGFSAPNYCRRTYQNITVRGVAPGSSRSNGTTAFAFEGSVRLQLLMDNGQKPYVDVDLRTIVGLSSADGAYRGTADVCRGGRYWPVLDPLGDSLPDKPHVLSSIAEEPAELCIDRDDRTFGPTGWALVTFNVEGVAYNQVTVESLTVSYAGSPTIVLRTAAPSQVDGLLSVWWYDLYPFLNFRDLTSRLPNQTFSVAQDVAPIVDQDYAFAFTPGAIGLTTDLTVTCVLKFPTSSGGSSFSRVTFTRLLRTDTSLTAASRFGPPVLTTTTVVEGPHSTVLAMAATGGLLTALLLVGVVTAVADTHQPLPKWMPRAIKFVPLRRRAKPGAVHKRATVGGIPVDA